MNVAAVSGRVIELGFPADARYLILARLSLVGVAPAAALEPEAVADLKLAVTEACANAVRHAYAGKAGPVRMRIELAQDTLTIEVADDGKGMVAGRIPSPDPARDLEGGMGFAIMRSLVDEVEVDSAPGRGTVVRLVKRLPPAV